MDKLEESVRHEVIRILTDDYGYRDSEIATEFPIPRGSKPSDRADIAVFTGSGRDPASDLVGIVETKRPGEKDGKGQLKSYMTATSAIWGCGLTVRTSNTTASPRVNRQSTPTGSITSQFAGSVLKM